MAGRKKLCNPEDDKSVKIITTPQENVIKSKKKNQNKKIQLRRSPLNPGFKRDEILNSIVHFPVDEILGKEKDEIVKNSILSAR
ncbi:unnamed protein product [Brachionus calyciflorus]|uniref:Uncharacterized protein n=1 Tax=Brachionus calyciflorus TaxID=104777 RepID=A0A814H3K8_9BILA|nr:unnamed protein product [Brachionus calyciflorus]